MKYEKYQLESDRKLLLFEFTSIGPKGKIRKIVQYAETNLKNYFNLGFGDKDELTGELKDFYVFGLKDNQWHEFHKHTEYEAFLTTRKKQ